MQFGGEFHGRKAVESAGLLCWGGLTRQQKLPEDVSFGSFPYARIEVSGRGVKGFVVTL